jgi:phosphate transport system substrate-binding protein
MKNTAITLLILAVLLISGCVSKKQKDNTLNFSGAFALYPLNIKWAEEYKKNHDDIRFNISGGGAGKGMADALAGTVDLGMFSREIARAEKDKGVWWVGLCKDAVIPTISKDNPYLEALKKRGITRDEFRKIFIEGSIKSWNEILPTAGDEAITVYTRSDACGAAGTWAKYLGGTQEDLKGVGVHGDPALAQAVSKDKFGLGFNNTIYIYDVKSNEKRPGMEIIPLDQNENGKIDPEESFYSTFDNVLAAIANGNYPSPPARELYFVSKGKPTKKATLDYLKWTLTEGQKFVKEAGYVPITQDRIDNYLKKLTQ